MLFEAKDQAPLGARLRAAPPDHSLAAEGIVQGLPDRAAAALVPGTATIAARRGRDDHRVGPGRSSAVRRRRDPHQYAVGAGRRRLLLLRGAGRQLTLPRLARLASTVDTHWQGQHRFRLSAEYVRQSVVAATHTPTARHGCPLGRPLALGGAPELVRRGCSSAAVPTLLGFEPPLVRCSSVCFPPTSGPATTVGGCGPSAAASTAISPAALDATDDSATRQTRPSLARGAATRQDRRSRSGCLHAG